MTSSTRCMPPSNASARGLHRWERKPWLRCDENPHRWSTASDAVASAVGGCHLPRRRKGLWDELDAAFSARRQRLYLVALAVATLLALELSSSLASVQGRPAAPLIPDQPPLTSAARPHAEPWATDMRERHLAESGSSSQASGNGRCGHVESQEDHNTHHSKAFEPIVFFMLAYISSAVAQEITAVMPSSFRVPHSVNLYLIGGGLARVARWFPDTEFGQTVRDFMDVDPHIIFWVLLPCILYEDSSGVNWHVMKKVLPSAILLAIPGVILNALLTGTLVKLTFGTIDWRWDSSFLMGSILSATDPVAVMSALHELHAPDQIALLISGESLVNDGSAVVIFSLFWESARGIRKLTPLYSAGVFLRMTFGGPILGLLIAMASYQWLKKTRKFNIEIILIMLSVFASFFLAEHPAVKVSGVLAVVAFGFFHAAHGHLALNIAEEARHHAILHFVALLSNEAIFVMAGVVSFRFMVEGSFEPQDWLELLLLYFMVHMTRALVMVVCMPLLRRWGYGLRWKEAFICVYGGLRGAVGLAMALMVEHDKRLDAKTRSRIAFHTSGIVLGTLLVNGTSISWVYRRLHLYKVPLHHEKLLALALRKANVTTRRLAAIFEGHWFFHNCHFVDLWRLVPNLAEAAEAVERHADEAQDGKISKLMVDTDSLWSGFKDKRSPAEEVDSILSDIAFKIGTSKESFEDRFVRKLRYRRKNGVASAANIFNLKVVEKAADKEADTHHQVVELALQMAREEMTRNNGAAFEANDMWANLLGNLRAAKASDAAEQKGDEEPPLYPPGDANHFESRQSYKSNFTEFSETWEASTRGSIATTATCQEPGRDDSNCVQSIAEADFSSMNSDESLKSLPKTTKNLNCPTLSMPNLDSFQSGNRGRHMSMGDVALMRNDDPSRSLPLSKGLAPPSTPKPELAGPVGFAVQRPSYLKAGMVEVLKRPAGRLPPIQQVQESETNPRSKADRKSTPSCAFKNYTEAQVKKEKAQKLEELKKARTTRFDEEQVQGHEESEKNVAHRVTERTGKVRFSCPADVEGTGDDFEDIFNWQSEYSAHGGHGRDSRYSRVSRSSRASMAHRQSMKRSQILKTLQRASTKRMEAENYNDGYQTVKVQAISGFLFETRAMNQFFRAARPTRLEEMPSRERAIYRWQFAKTRVLWALKKIDEAQRQRKILWQEIEEEFERRRSMASVFNHASDRVLSDAHTFAEIYETVLTATRALYKAMYRIGSIDVYPYSILMDALEFQEEAVKGDLRAIALPKRTSVSSIEEITVGLEKKSQDEQMIHCFTVAWFYITRKLRKQPLEVFLWFEKNFSFCSGWTVAGEWWFMRRDIELILAYTVTHDQMAELPLVKDFKPVEHQIRNVSEKAKATVLYELMAKDAPMFAIFEHVLCARLMICAQRRLLNEMTESGVLTEHDAHNLISKVIDPVQTALENYVPTKLQLAMCRHKEDARRKSRLSGLLDFLVPSKPTDAQKHSLFQAVMTTGSKENESTRTPEQGALWAWEQETAKPSGWLSNIFSKIRG